MESGESSKSRDKSHSHPLCLCLAQVARKSWRQNFCLFAQTKAHKNRGGQTKQFVISLSAQVKLSRPARNSDDAPKLPLLSCCHLLSVCSSPLLLLARQSEFVFVLRQAELWLLFGPNSSAQANVCLAPKSRYAKLRPHDKDDKCPVAWPLFMIVFDRDRKLAPSRAAAFQSSRWRRPRIWLIVGVCLNRDCNSSDFWRII